MAAAAGAAQRDVAARALQVCATAGACAVLCECGEGRVWLLPLAPLDATSLPGPYRCAAVLPRTVLGVMGEARTCYSDRNARAHAHTTHSRAITCTRSPGENPPLDRLEAAARMVSSKCLFTTDMLKGKTHMLC